MELVEASDLVLEPIESILILVQIRFIQSLNYLLQLLVELISHLPVRHVARLQAGVPIAHLVVHFGDIFEHGRLDAAADDELGADVVQGLRFVHLHLHRVVDVRDEQLQVLVLLGFIQHGVVSSGDEHLHVLALHFDV